MNTRKEREREPKMQMSGEDKLEKMIIKVAGGVIRTRDNDMCLCPRGAE